MKLILLYILFPMVIAQNSKLDLGVKLFQKNVVGKINLLTYPAQTERCFIIKNDSIEYNVAITNDSIINYISTNDINFKTIDGYNVGSNYTKINEIKITHWRGWGKFIKLDSGWNAVFKDELLNNDSKIIFFFKFDKKLRTIKKKDDLKMKIKW